MKAGTVAISGKGKLQKLQYTLFIGDLTASDGADKIEQIARSAAAAIHHKLQQFRTQQVLRVADRIDLSDLDEIEIETIETTEEAE